MTDPSQYLFWITTRAAGTTAMIFASASVGVGLAMSAKLIKGPDRRNLHRGWRWRRWSRSEFTQCRCS
jgi:hypothetical protein